MTDEDGAVKITDFGIAKITAVTSMTQTRTVVGTPNYMSPEQVQGLAVDGRSDQFSLAVIAYEILTGERPFQGEHLSTIVYRIVAEQPPEAHQINGTLTPQIHEVLSRGLAKKPEDRYPTCSTFVGALEMACAESRGWKTVTAGGAAALPTTAMERPAETETIPVVAPERFSASDTIEKARRPSVLAPLLMSVLVVLGVGGVILWQTGMIPVGLFGEHVAEAQKNDAQKTDTPPPADNTSKVDTAPAPDITPNDTRPAEARTETQAVSDTPAAVDSATSTPAPQPAPPAVAKPSPFEPGPKITPTETVKIPAPARNQDVWVTSNPPGAKAVLDDNLAQTCRTPCMLHGAPGVHRLTLTQAGFENESREIHIGEMAFDLPPITLRKPNGTLMLTTSPPGASVRVNGKLVPETTPAQIKPAAGHVFHYRGESGPQPDRACRVERAPALFENPAGAIRLERQQDFSVCDGDAVGRILLREFHPLLFESANELVEVEHRTRRDIVKHDEAPFARAAVGKGARHPAIRGRASRPRDEFSRARRYRAWAPPPEVADGCPVCRRARTGGRGVRVDPSHSSACSARSNSSRAASASSSPSGVVCDQVWLPMR